MCCSVSDDIGTNLTQLRPLSEAVVSAFVPRLGDNKGLLPVRLKLTGPGGMPGAAAIQVGCGQAGCALRHTRIHHHIWGGQQAHSSV